MAVQRREVKLDTRQDTPYQPHRLASSRQRTFAPSPGQPFCRLSGGGRGGREGGGEREGGREGGGREGGREGGR